MVISISGFECISIVPGNLLLYKCNKNNLPCYVVKSAIIILWNKYSNFSLINHVIIFIKILLTVSFFIETSINSTMILCEFVFHFSLPFGRIAVCLWSTCTPTRGTQLKSAANSTLDWTTSSPLRH